MNASDLEGLFRLAIMDRLDRLMRRALDNAVNAATPVQPPSHDPTLRVKDLERLV